MPTSDPTAPKPLDLESAEARMRRALGLAGSRDEPAGPSRPEQRPKVLSRPPDRPVGERPRQRFVKDGDVPVTVVTRHRPHDADALDAPSLGRAGIVATALATERAARERAERSLQEALAAVHDLRTKQGHAELAQREASEGIRAAHEAAVKALQAEHEGQVARLNEQLAAERALRTAAEAALQEAAAREPAGRDLPATVAAKPAPKPAPAQRAANAPASAKAKRGTASASARREPQPVRWWLKTAAKK